ncbi:MAG: response regulator transcription factor [Saprospiraceae bacterium]|nr:response regulator transcription factor [Saprospiraceae bacterium]
MNVIIVDDEPLALEVIETYVEQIAELNLVGKCQNALEANELLRNNQVDLMFLDIQMPQITGIDFLKSLDNPPMVIFTTAYADYAVEGFELNAVDYLMKPISLDRFMKAVNKARENFERAPESSSTEEGAEFIFVKADKKLIKLFYKDIIYIEGLKDYVIMRHESGRTITLQTMKSLEKKLPEGTFKRIHRSYIVNMAKINAVLGNMVEVTEKGQAKHIPVGKNYREDLLTVINQNRL